MSENDEAVPEEEIELEFYDASESLDESNESACNGHRSTDANGLIFESQQLHPPDTSEDSANVSARSTPTSQDQPIDGAAILSPKHWLAAIGKAAFRCSAIISCFVAIITLGVQISQATMQSSQSNSLQTRATAHAIAFYRYARRNETPLAHQNASRSMTQDDASITPSQDQMSAFEHVIPLVQIYWMVKAVIYVVKAFHARILCRMLLPWGRHLMRLCTIYVAKAPAEYLRSTALTSPYRQSNELREALSDPTHLAHFLETAFGPEKNLRSPESPEMILDLCKLLLPGSELLNSCNTNAGREELYKILKQLARTMSSLEKACYSEESDPRNGDKFAAIRARYFGDAVERFKMEQILLKLG